MHKMTLNYIESSSGIPEIIVFDAQFECITNQDYELECKKFDESFEVLQKKQWEKHWRLRGDKILKDSWYQKLQNYSTDSGNSADASSDSTENSVDDEGRNSIVQVSTTCEFEVRENHDYTQEWLEFWQKHCEDVYAEQYLLFTPAFYNYYLSYRKHLTPLEDSLPSSPEASIHDEAILQESIHLEALGLPTSFGYQLSKKRTRYQEEKTKLKVEEKENLCEEFETLFLDDSDDEDNIEEEQYFSEDGGFDTCTDMDEKPEAIETAELPKQSNNPSQHKRRNRKLRHVPSFLRNEAKMLKYWRRRFSLFSRYDEGIQLDRESWFSVTPEKVAVHLAERLRCAVIVDGFCGCGGNTIQFAKTCQKVIAVDIDPKKLEMAKHNAGIYGVQDKIEFIAGDFLQLSRSGALRGDIVFLSPPWGGPNYKKKQDYNIETRLEPVGATELMECARKVSNNVALFLPRNSNLPQVIKLAGVGQRCEVEHNFLDTRLVAITALYGENILSVETANDPNENSS